jgi:phosphocarrier protein
VSEAEVQVTNKLGLHARAAARFVHLANQFSARISVAKAGTRVDGKSILGLLTLAASKGTRLTLIADGEDEAEAVAQLGKLVGNGFDEGE